MIVIGFFVIILTLAAIVGTVALLHAVLDIEPPNNQFLGRVSID